jgi:hypothetical protein
VGRVPGGSLAFIRADASGPKHCTAVRGSTVSGVSMPISRTRTPPVTRIVSPSVTDSTAVSSPSGTAGVTGAVVVVAVTGCCCSAVVVVRRARSGVVVAVAVADRA